MMKKILFSLASFVCLFYYSATSQCDFGCIVEPDCNLFCNGEFVYDNIPLACPPGDYNHYQLLPDFPGWRGLGDVQSEVFFCPGANGHPSNIGGYTQLSTYNKNLTNDIYSGVIQAAITLTPDQPYVLSFWSKITEPLQSNYENLAHFDIFLMKSIPEDPTCVFRFRNFNQSMWDNPLYFQGGSGNINIDVTTDLYPIYSATNLNHYSWTPTTKCFIAPPNADEYDRIIFMPRKGLITTPPPHPKVRSDIQIDNISLVENNFSAGPDQMVCQNDLVALFPINNNCPSANLNYVWYGDDGNGAPDYSAGPISSVNGVVLVPTSNPGVFTYHLVNYFPSGSDSDCQLYESVTITVVKISDHAFFKVYLEGPFLKDAGNVNMTNYLNIDPFGQNLLYRGLLPGMNSTPAGQPYSTPPWNYPGTEGAGYTNTSYHPNVVDWVLVSLWTESVSNPGHPDAFVTQRAGLLHKNGSVYFTESCPFLTIPDGDYFVKITHRNHMEVMSHIPVTYTNGQIYYDFTGQNSYRGGGIAHGQKEVEPGVFAMFAGDFDQAADLNSSDINGQDNILWEEGNGLFDQYLIQDANLNGDVNGTDKIFWFYNNGFFNIVPK